MGRGKGIHVEPSVPGLKLVLLNKSAGENANNSNNTKTVTRQASPRTPSESDVPKNENLTTAFRTNSRVSDVCNGNAFPKSNHIPKDFSDKSSGQVSQSALKFIKQEWEGRSRDGSIMKTRSSWERSQTQNLSSRKEIFEFWGTQETHNKESSNNKKPLSKRQPSIEQQAFKVVKMSTFSKVSDGRFVHMEFCSEKTGSRCEKENGKQPREVSFSRKRKSRRDLFLNANVFSLVDSHVLCISKQLKSEGECSVLKVVQQITERCHTDLERIRAIWIWLCNNIEYDISGFLGLSEKISAPEQVLQSGRGVCSGYSSLCREMCREVGISCVEVSGYGKGIGYKLGQSYQHKKSNHMWNAVQLEGQWYLLDACWGAGTVNTEKQVFIQRYDEFYFLVDPEEFIDSHWPDDSTWQLMEPIVPLEEFEKRVFKTSEFYRLALSIILPKTSILQTDGEATVLLACAAPLEFSYQLSQVCGDTIKDIDKSCGMVSVSHHSMKLKVLPPTRGLYDLMIFAKPVDSQGRFSWVCSCQINCNDLKCSEKLPQNPFHFWGFLQNAISFGMRKCSYGEDPIISKTGTLEFIFQTSRPLLAMYELAHEEMETSVAKRCIISQIEKDKLTCHVLCPLKGYYRLSVFVKDMQEQNFKNAGNFLIHCMQPVNLNELFPPNLSMHCGPGVKTAEVGLSRPSHPGPIINTNEGRCNITFQSSSDIEVTVVLTKDQDTDNTKHLDINRYVLVTHLENKVTISVCLPESGIYRLALFTGASDKKEFSHICDYVVRCFSNPCWSPFPRVYSMWKKGCVLLEPRSGVLEENSWARFRVRIPGAYKVFLIGQSKSELSVTKNKVWEGKVSTGPTGSVVKLAAKSSDQSPAMDVIMSFDVGSLNRTEDSSG
ncbi:kyphoscoliosis peptidase isoform X2 [Latimeria chalumnae]|uniref:kyphoscoliosis peptidase isoform X2 n=1 Tax=Latimeria chalumnae TaxID=7897 RepID=UPI0003C144EE|nr:PREDICTED: kyphoscoliosis peptidase-like isoform X2 [Latimeria chalumnae]|eukprot:XP_005997493.1 PREDICTED: kyphoscoliosis peptidase-like isoform X2 [Latimeria chalumnae]